VKFEPVASEKSAAEKAAEVLIAFGWLAFFILLTVSPIVIVAIWKALL
jgi:hypothetical protein